MLILYTGTHEERMQDLYTDVWLSESTNAQCHFVRMSHVAQDHLEFAGWMHRRLLLGTSAAEEAC